MQNSPLLQHSIYDACHFCLTQTFPVHVDTTNVIGLETRGIVMDSSENGLKDEGFVAV
jgi:hypothetical protein